MSAAIPPVPAALADHGQHLRLIAASLNPALQGKLNATKSIVLTPFSATTELVDQRIGPGSCLLFMPETANAVQALAGLYVSNRRRGTATLNHAFSSSSDRAFTALIIG